MTPIKRMALAATVLANLLLAGTVSAQWSTSGNTGGGQIGTTNTNPLVLKSNNTERARFLGTGELGIGTTTPGTSRLLDIFAATSTAQFRLGENATDTWSMWGGKEFHVTEDGSFADWIFFSPSGFLNRMDFGPGTEIHVDFSTGTSFFGTNVSPHSRLTISGNVAPNTDNLFDLGSSTKRWDVIWACNGTIQTSDASLKENIHGLGYGIDAVMKLRPVSFLWKDGAGDGRKLGLIAQEVRKVIPEVVKGDETIEPLGIIYTDLIPVMINAVHSQQTELSSRVAENETLRRQIDQRAERIARLEAAVKANAAGK